MTRKDDDIEAARCCYQCQKFELGDRILARNYGGKGRETQRAKIEADAALLAEMCELVELRLARGTCYRYIAVDDVALKFSTHVRFAKKGINARKAAANFILGKSGYGKKARKEHDEI